MISRFLREQKRYTQKELCQILQCSEEKVVPLIRKLKEYGVLKAVKASDVQRNMSDLLDEDIEVADVEAGENEYLYVFTFVGVITVAGRVLKCYPKYILNVSDPKEELKTVLKVLERYNSKEQIIRMWNESSESQSFNLLAVLLFLLNDYYENGSYSNTEDIIESNGTGEILWEKTINETFTYLSNGRPYYTDLQTKKRVNDDYDYFKRLHECLITVASKELEEADLLDLFEITGADLSDEDLDDFGDKEYILYRIERELNVQFNTRKQLVLKAIYAYVDRHGSLMDIDGLSMFGTNSFNLVWEDVCKAILDDKLDKPLRLLKLPVPLRDEYNDCLSLLDLIEKPFWSATGMVAADTLIPDAVSIAKSGCDDLFIIFDAKYYVPRLTTGKPPKSMPGIESVTKQYLYQMAYKQFMKDHGFTKSFNCFIMPTEKEEIIDKGYVSMKMFEGLALDKILVRMLPAAKAYEYYLSGKTLPIVELKMNNKKPDGFFFFFFDGEKEESL